MTSDASTRLSEDQNAGKSGVEVEILKDFSFKSHNFKTGDKPSVDRELLSILKTEGIIKGGRKTRPTNKRRANSNKS